LKIAVVILNWNGVQLLEKFLPSVVAFSDEATIYVADNASTDNSISFLKEHFPAVKIIENSGNFGYAKGYNDALRFVEEDIYALVNSDIEVTENWLQPILQTFKNETETAIIQPRILDYKNKDYFEYAGAAGGFIDKYGYPFCRGRIFTSIEKDDNQYSDSDIFWASGACLFIRKDVFRKLNGFDADFFAHQEEIDLCWRAFNNGFKSKFISKCVVYHVGGATLNHSNPRKTYLNFRNSLSMLVKNLPKSKLFTVIFIRLTLDGIAGIRFVFNGQFSHCIAILKSHFSFYALLMSNYKKREKSQNPAYYKRNSIVYDYYLSGKKVFSKLL